MTSTISALQSLGSRKKISRPIWLLVDFIKGLAVEKNVTPAQIAISWLLYQKPWIVPIPGSRSLKHLTDNIEAANITYTDDEMRRIDEVLGKIVIHGDRYNANNQANVGK